jgi:hypothetical protein
VTSTDDNSVSSAFWKRPAWLFSAFASVSNHSAMSEKPSSRAVFAMPGYIVSYSCVSPATAALRFLALSPIGRPVAGSPTLARKSRWPCAWPVSPSAVSLKRPATSGSPSMSAFFAKYR